MARKRGNWIKMRRKPLLTALQALLVLTILTGIAGAAFPGSKLQIVEVDKPKERREHHRGGKYVWDEKAVKVRVKNKAKKWISGIEFSLCIYGKDKRLIETRQNFRVSLGDKGHYDNRERSIEGKKTITVWFHLSEGFLRKHKPKYYEARLLKDGVVKHRMTAPRSFLADLKEKESDLKKKESD